MDREFAEYLDRKLREATEQITERVTAVVTERVTAKVTEQIQELRCEMKQGHDELRQDNRETRILLEDLRGDVRLVAEGVANSNERLDRHMEESNRRFAEERAFTRTACSQLDVRVTKLERKVFPKASRG